jgi:hypothetical protein
MITFVLIGAGCNYFPDDNSFMYLPKSLPSNSNIIVFDPLDHDKSILPKINTWCCDRNIKFVQSRVDKMSDISTHINSDSEKVIIISYTCEVRYLNIKESAYFKNWFFIYSGHTSLQYNLETLINLENVYKPALKIICECVHKLNELMDMTLYTLSVGLARYYNNEYSKIVKVFKEYSTIPVLNEVIRLPIEKLYTINNMLCQIIIRRNECQKYSSLDEYLKNIHPNCHSNVTWMVEVFPYKNYRYETIDTTTFRIFE